MQNRGGPSPEDSRNMMVAVVLMLAIVLGFEMFYNAPQREKLIAAEQARIEAEQAANPTPAPAAPAAPAGPVAREASLAESAAARVTLDTPSIDGSIYLRGARFDDVNLKHYRRTIDQDSPEVALLIPDGARHAYDAVLGWEEQNPHMDAQGYCLRHCGVGSNDVWSAPEGSRLTPETPLTLTLTTGDGLEITRTVSVDADYMFTIRDEVRNTSAEPRALRPFGVVRRDGLPEDYVTQAVVHQGFVGAFGDENIRLQSTTYKQAQDHVKKRTRGRVGEDERIRESNSNGGWFGISDHYWLTAIIVDQSERMHAYYDARGGAGEIDYRAAYQGSWREVPAGGAITYTQRLFAGAKRVTQLQAYQEELNIPRFDDAVDWGNFWFLTRPFFNWLLHPLALWVGNFGIGILLTTVVIKLVLFPLIYQSYKSMAKMRALQPKMKEIQERYAADKQRMQQEQMRLFQTEKINPVAGCLPILMQIPVFYALYKVLSVTIEMRHAPFFGWIRDLSARDPTSIFNLFGLLPFDPAAIPLIGPFLMIGAWALMYGVSMWLLQALSPPPTDPVQAKIFQFLPVLFTVMFASFPAGMVIYWTWSNVLSIVQQYAIMRRQGVETQLDQFIAKRLRRENAKPAG